eukprot:gene30392-35400_t
MSSMGDSTRRRLAAVVHNANAMGAPGAAGTSHGGYGGGMGGSFGKASRGLNSFGKPAGSAFTSRLPSAIPQWTAPYTNAVIKRWARTSNSGARLSSSGGAEGGAPAITEAHMTALEDQIRDAIRDKRSVYEGSKEMLLKHFKPVYEGSKEMLLKHFKSVFEGSKEMLLKHFKLIVFAAFATRGLCMRAQRRLCYSTSMRKGAFQAGQSANFNGKVLYKPCRTGVYTPSDWDPSLAERSSELPDARLVLEFVYGYQDNNIVYFTAGVGVVYQRPPVHHQYFFLGHADDISALALCSAPIDFDGRSFPAKTLVATGQVTSVEEGACICIWNSRNAAQSRQISSKEDAGFCALAFSPSGTRLACVAMDNYHSVYVYDWRKQRVLSNGRGQSGDPPQVYGLGWNPYEITHNCPSAFVTFGNKHIKMLALRARNASRTALIAPGTSAVKAITAHRPGPNVLQSDGRNAYHGVRGLRGVKNGTVLLSGGAAGQVLQWDTSDGNLQDSRFVAPAIQLSSPLGPNDNSMLPR